MGLFGVKAKGVLDKGELTRGRIVGIRISVTKDEDNIKFYRHEYALEVHSPAPFVAGVRQQLLPSEFVRLGMDVAVRHAKGRAVIDWHATGGGTYGKPFKLLKKPPAYGIIDDSLGLDKVRHKSDPAQCTIVAAHPGKSHFGMRPALHLEVVVQAGGQPYSVVFDKINPPHYATHLVGVGTVLPVWVRHGHPNDVRIDWPAAAMAYPGVGMPPAC